MKNIFSGWFNKPSKKEIEVLSSLHNSILRAKSLSDETAKLISESYKNGKGDEIKEISTETFEGIEQGAWINLGEGINSFCIVKEGNKYMFLVINEKNKSINAHYHTSDEEIKIIKGKLRDKLTGIISKPDDIIYLKAYTPHFVEALEYSIYLVYINKK